MIRRANVISNLNDLMISECPMAQYLRKLRICTLDTPGGVISQNRVSKQDFYLDIFK